MWKHWLEIHWLELLELIFLTILLATLVILVVWSIGRIGRWSRHGEQTSLPFDEEIAAFRLLLEQGFLTQEEFDRVCARLKNLGPPEASSGPSSGSVVPPGQEPPASEPKT